MQLTNESEKMMTPGLKQTIKYLKTQKQINATREQFWLQDYKTINRNNRIIKNCVGGFLKRHCLVFHFFITKPNFKEYH